jgi:hypothetical protein
MRDIDSSWFPKQSVQLARSRCYGLLIRITLPLICAGTRNRADRVRKRRARQPGRMRALTVVAYEMLRARRLLVGFVRARG